MGDQQENLNQRTSPFIDWNRVQLWEGGVFIMRIVVVKLPKMLCGLARRIFKM